MKGMMKSYTNSSKTLPDGKDYPWGEGEIIGSDGNIYTFDITTFIRSGIGGFPLMDYSDTNPAGYGTSVLFEATGSVVDVIVYPAVEW